MLTPAELEAIEDATLDRIHRERMTAVLSGWVSEYCARVRLLPTPADLIAKLFPPTGAAKQARSVTLPPQELRRLFLELTEALGGEVRTK